MERDFIRSELMRATTVHEILNFTKAFYKLSDYDLEIEGDIIDFVAEHIKRNCTVFSRGDDGRIRAVLFGWPVDIHEATRLSGKGNSLDSVESSECIYINMLILHPKLSQGTSIKAVLAMGARVQEKWGRDIIYVAYHRAKYDNRFRINRFSAKELV